MISASLISLASFFSHFEHYCRSYGLATNFNVT